MQRSTADPYRTPQWMHTSHTNHARTMESSYPMAQSYYYDQRQYPDMPYYVHHHHQQQQHHGLPIMNMHQMATANAFRGSMNMTSAPAQTTPASSNPTSTATTKPAIIVQPGSLMPLDTRFVSTDYYGFPSTPPLSASGSSVISSPPASGTQNTFSDSLLAFDKVEGVKEGCEGDVHAEILANPEWSRSDSPPMTPVFIHPPSLTASQTSDLLSTNSSCPSLSPSPSPVSSSFDPHAAIVSQSQQSAATATLSVEPAGAHFCDPRELTVESSLGADLPPLPTLSEETKLDDTPVALQEAPVGHEQQQQQHHHHQPSSSVAEDALTALPTFDSFSELDSDDEFVNLVDFPPSQNAFFLGDKRQRVSYPEEDGFLSEPADEVDEHTGFSFEPSVPASVTPAAAAPAPAPAPAPAHAEKEKKRKTMKRSSTVDSDCSSHNHAHAHVHTDAREDEPRQVSEVSESGAPVSVNRRGRKQSLTDDPSKTFVCTLCSRRFRRQEHLKRHYRSLHTQDKPFECTECGKKFSRSDNLAQHARTHGGQSMMMGVLENPVTYEDEQASSGGATTTAGLGAVLYDVEDGASRSNKKRKRDDQ